MTRSTHALPGLVLAIALLATAGSASAESTPEEAYRDYAFLKEVCDAPVPVAMCAAVVPLCKARPTAVEIASAKPALASCLGAAGAPSAPILAADAAKISWIPAVTDFLVARARAELALFLKDRVADAICDHDVSKTLLPQTCTVLKGDDDLLVGIPGALRTDLDQLPTNLHNLAVTKLPSVAAGPAQRAGCLALVAWDVYPALRDMGPLGALQYLTAYNPAPPCDTAVAKIVAWATTLVPVLDGLSRTPPGTYIDPVALQATLRVAAIAAGLDSQVDRIDRAMPSLLTLISALREMRLKPIDRLSAARALEQLATILVALADAADAPALREGLLGAADIASARYASGIHHLALAAKGLLKDDASAVVAGLVRYAVLVSGLAAAESDEEVTSILEGAAAPLGSYREYRRSFSGFIAGRAGIAGGVELGVGDVEGTFEPFLPVGVEIGGPLPNKYIDSWNLMVSIADLGAVAAARIGDSSGDAGVDETAKTTTDTDFAKVFAPGVFLGLGFYDSPFVFSVGAQYLPTSREVFDCSDSAPCSTTRRVPVLRAMASLAIDLPVFPLFR